MSIAAMKQALEALEASFDILDPSMYPNEENMVAYAITALRDALEQQEKVEPVGYIWRTHAGELKFAEKTSWNCWTPVYTTPQPAIPDGWQLVPVEPTPEMQRAMQQAEWPDEAYKAMLAAAPKEMK